MLAEIVARAGQGVLGDARPNGNDYWAARFWDRDAAERHPSLATDYERQKKTIAGYLQQYGGAAKRTAEFACGTGEFTRLTAELTSASEIIALDISEHALNIARARVKSDRVKFLAGDFWADHCIEPADLVLCVDAVHHLGDVRDVLVRLRSFIRPGGVVIGNIVTDDNFHDFQRKRHGSGQHFVRTLLFFGTAVLIRVSGGRLRTASYRTQLRSSMEVATMLEQTFGAVLAISTDRYFTAFACRF
jgi:SAM-dependent methyltransferase